MQKDKNKQVPDAGIEAGQRRPRPGLKEWVLDPFTYIAGGRSLLLGLTTILLASAVGSLSKTHFDGVLDVHTGRPASVGVFLLEGIIDWLCLASMLFVAGKISSRSAFRPIDLFGTQALARWPTVIMAGVALLPAYQRSLAAIVQAVTQPGSGYQLPIADAAVFALAALVMLLAEVWMVALMYRSYSVCCNIGGWRAGISFVIGLLAAEAISKVAILRILAN